MVNAARGLAGAQFALAEAVYAEIPPRGRGRRPAGEATNGEMFDAAAAEILAETGEHYSAKTLEHYRNVAAWAAGGKSSGAGTFPWADASWTAHREAFEKNLSWEEFTQGKRTKRAVRQQAGISTGDVPAAARAINANPDEAEKFVEGLDQKGMDAVIKAGTRRELNRIPGVTAHQHQDVPDPRGLAMRYVDAVRSDLNGYRSAYLELREQDPGAADVVDSEFRDLIASINLWLDPVPDSPEGIER